MDNQQTFVINGTLEECSGGGGYDPESWMDISGDGESLQKVLAGIYEAAKHVEEVEGVKILQYGKVKLRVTIERIDCEGFGKESVSFSMEARRLREVLRLRAALEDIRKKEIEDCGGETFITQICDEALAEAD